MQGKRLQTKMGSVQLHSKVGLGLAGEQGQRAHLHGRLARRLGVQPHVCRQAAVERARQVETLLGADLPTMTSIVWRYADVS
jgi:hypothetical protein